MRATETLRTSAIALALDLAAIAVAVRSLMLLVPDIRAQSWVYAAIDLIVIVWVVRWMPRRWRDFSSADHRLRAELIRAARPLRKKEVWLNRDEHVIFNANHFLGTHLRRWDERDFFGIDAAGHGAAVSVTYVAAASEWGILRVVDGMEFTEGPGGDPVPKKDIRSEWAKWRDAAKLARWSASGAMRADAAEIRKVLTELAGAELISRPE
jgi:hypothetical protein